jgi:hypothetical protein
MTFIIHKRLCKIKLVTAKSEKLDAADAIAYGAELAISLPNHALPLKGSQLL